MSLSVNLPGFEPLPPTARTDVTVRAAGGVLVRVTNVPASHDPESGALVPHVSVCKHVVRLADAWDKLMTSASGLLVPVVPYTEPGLSPVELRLV